MGRIPVLFTIGGNSEGTVRVSCAVAIKGQSYGLFYAL